MSASESVQILLPLLPYTSSISRLLLTTVLALIIFPLSLAQSLASKRIVYPTWLSLVTYITWLGCIIYAYTRGIPLAHSGWLRMGTVWQGVGTFGPTLF